MPFRNWILAALVSTAMAAAQSAGDEKALFDGLPPVEAVSPHAQTLAEAPANVTVISRNPQLWIPHAGGGAGSRGGLLRDVTTDNIFNSDGLPLGKSSNFEMRLPARIGEKT